MAVLALLLQIIFPVIALAQFGHPLKGQWSGEWGPKDKPSRVLLDLDWDGKAITGIINPGTDNIPVKNATLNPEGWVVHLEADAKDKSGRALTYVVDGRIENLHLPGRAVTGTWKNQKESGAFKITRQ